MCSCHNCTTGPANASSKYRYHWKYMSFCKCNDVFVAYSHYGTSHSRPGNNQWYKREGASFCSECLLSHKWRRILRSKFSLSFNKDIFGYRQITVYQMCRQSDIYITLIHWPLPVGDRRRWGSRQLSRIDVQSISLFCCVWAMSIIIVRINWTATLIVILHIDNFGTNSIDYHILICCHLFVYLYTLLYLLSGHSLLAVSHAYILFHSSFKWDYVF